MALKLLEAQKETFDDAVKARPKLVLIWTTLGWAKFIKMLRDDVFSECEYPCRISEDRSLVSDADAIIFHAHNTRPGDLPAPETRSSKQIYAVYDHESPVRMPERFFNIPRHFFNATLTYRPESDYFAAYDHLVPTGDKAQMWSEAEVEAAYLKKSKPVFAMISNCREARSRRQDYIRALGKHINITLKGRCFEPDKPRCDANCVRDLEESHFFVLSFENSVCDHYVTEKFWRMKRLIVPIVLKRSVVQASAPFDTFIAADDFKSPQALAEFLIDASLDKSKYMKYLEWTRHFAKTFSNPVHEAFCALCRDLHHPKLRIRREHDDFHTMWNTKYQCHKDHVKRLLRET